MDILVIDDDPAVSDLLKIQVKSSKFGVRVAYSGSDGIKSARYFKPDIIILDLVMPDMDGLEACKRIREFSHAPILVISAIDQPMTVANALNAGADDYLVKPVSSAMLLAYLQKFSRRIPASTHSISQPII